jgi:tetratricopeptide (TPR) repeat protein
MSHIDSLRAYYDLAELLFINQITESVLPNAVIQLPPPYAQLVDEIVARAEQLSINEPKRSWALTQVICASTEIHDCDPFLRSLSAWYLCRAANQWGQPKRVAATVAAARKGFESLGDKGWQAACDWQQFTLSWAQPDYLLAAIKLAQALNQLERSGLTDFVPHCRMSLAYAQILVGKFEAAEENTHICEQYFASRSDDLDQARCWLNFASSFRRQGNFEEALKLLANASSLFTSRNAVVDDAKVHYQIALCHLLRSDDLHKATSEFDQASKVFASRDMDLWQAACISNLGYVHLLLGELSSADTCFRHARTCFSRHEVLGLLANNLNDNGKLNAIKGLYETSLNNYKEAARIDQKLGAKNNIAVDHANLGETYGKMGRYQDALHYLESAADKFEELGDHFRLGACEKFISHIWTMLGNFTLALEHLEKAETYHNRSNQKALLSSIYNEHASILFKLGQNDKAMEYLKMSLNVAQAHGVRPQAALAQRLLGEAMVQIDLNGESCDYLEKAKDDFSNMGMVVEQAFSLIDLGLYFVMIRRFEEARKVFTEALVLSSGNFFEVDWRAYAGLASLAEKEGDATDALHAYQKGAKALQRICATFWQPALIGSYLQNPTAFFDKAISTAVHLNAPTDSLLFIEMNKSATLNSRLLVRQRYQKKDLPQKLNDLYAEINWLQHQMRVSFDESNPIKSSIQTRQIRAQLSEKMKIMDTMQARFERQTTIRNDNDLSRKEFSLEQFQNLAATHVGENWIALDYHLNADRLITTAVTSDNCHLYSTALSERVKMVLSILARNHPMNPSLHPKDVRILGDFLIPEALHTKLSQDMVLIIAPHKLLHGIPWAAIWPNGLRDSLIRYCIPVIVPSLKSLCTIWSRPAQDPFITRQKGLLFAVSEFQDAFPTLLHVKTEIADLVELDPSCQVLAEANATWDHLAASMTARKHSNSRRSSPEYSWLHIASHFSADTRTGRLSQIVLQNGAISLDQLRDLFLPPLVTFSTCNGLYSYIYEGDEHVSFQTACLIAGTKSVVGSVWPVPDHAASIFATTFYKYFLAGDSPARSVALAQRKMIEKEMNIGDWAGFQCTGAP